MSGYNYKSSLFFMGEIQQYTSVSIICAATARLNDLTCLSCDQGFMSMKINAINFHVKNFQREKLKSLDCLSAGTRWLDLTILNKACLTYRGT